MATVEELTAGINELNTTINAIDLKLDEVAAYIATLQANQPVSQAQLDELVALVNAVKTQAAAVLAEADTQDGN